MFLTSLYYLIAVCLFNEILNRKDSLNHFSLILRYVFAPIVLPLFLSTYGLNGKDPIPKGISPPLFCFCSFVL